jgi:hypothetical protein
MNEDDRSGFWIPAGMLGAVGLGILLIPLRTVTSASNLAFVFIAFTIVVAEFGGRTAAVATAIVSAMSLNFFLTEPYLTLAINKPDDMIAFLALIACGLIAAAFGTNREHSTQAASRARDDLEALQRMAAPLRSGAPMLTVLDELRQSFGLGRIVLRAADDHILAASPAETEPPAPAAVALNPDTLFAAGQSRYQFGRRGLRLPEGGGRFSVPTDRGSIVVDLWEGDPAGLDQEARRALSIAASMLALGLAAHPDPTTHG